jgi:2',3'-cyclic-nucleotide 2'-phosphodiesterase (5'-nucleotidase family)
MRWHAAGRFCIRARYSHLLSSKDAWTKVHLPVGFLTLGDVLEILPFEDPLVVLEISGKTLWETLEASLSTWPAQEG